MTDEINGPEEIREIHKQHLEVINQMVQDRDRHQAERPDCGAAPMCMGPSAVMSMSLMIRTLPDFAPSVIMVAVAEISETRRRLEAQRECTAAETVRAEAAEERVRDLEARCQGLQGDLDAYESCDELLRPGLTVTDPEELP